MTSRGHDTVAFTYKKAGCDVVTSIEKPALQFWSAHCGGKYGVHFFGNPLSVLTAFVLADAIPIVV